MKNIQWMLRGREVSEAENKQHLAEVQQEKGLSQATAITPDVASRTARLRLENGSALAVCRYAADAPHPRCGTDVGIKDFGGSLQSCSFHRAGFVHDGYNTEK